LDKVEGLDDARIAATTEYVALDVESTGLYKNDRIVEIALIAFREGTVIEEWATLVNPQRDVGKTNIHGITASMVSAAPLFEEIANDISRLINNRVIVAHNATFDLRILGQEFGRLEVQGHLGKGFCTMIASRRLLPLEADTLTATCAALGFEREGAHSALGDARMAMRVFGHLQEDQQEVRPAQLGFDPFMNPSRQLLRSAFGTTQVDAIETIHAFTRRIPFPTSEEKFVAYLLLLNLAMQDLIISEAEREQLGQWAADLGVTRLELSTLHEGYLQSFIQATLRDGVISDKERVMIEMVGRALELPVSIPESPLRIAENADNLRIGSRVCFTGEPLDDLGQPIRRTQLEALAARVGLHPVNSVTKKGCDVLVAADDSSMSGKAKKAREWGIAVVSVDKFLAYCGSNGQDL